MPRLKVAAAKMPPELVQRLREWSNRLGVSVSELIREAVTAYLDSEANSSGTTWWTGNGDLGATFNPVARARTLKHHPCVEALGALDEAAAAVALARALAREKGLRQTAALLEVAEDAAWRLLAWLGSSGTMSKCVKGLADRLGRAAASVEIPPGFRVNGASVAAAAAALARTLARRAERALVACVYSSASKPSGWEEALSAANRLSSLLYAAQVAADSEQSLAPPEPPCSGSRTPEEGGRRARV